MLCVLIDSDSYERQQDEHETVFDSMFSYRFTKSADFFSQLMNRSPFPFLFGFSQMVGGQIGNRCNRSGRIRWQWIPNV